MYRTDAGPAGVSKPTAQPNARSGGTAARSPTVKRHRESNCCDSRTKDRPGSVASNRSPPPVSGRAASARSSATSSGEPEDAGNDHEGSVRAATGTARTLRKITSPPASTLTRSTWSSRRRKASAGRSAGDATRNRTAKGASRAPPCWVSPDSTSPMARVSAS